MQFQIYSYLSLDLLFCFKSHLYTLYQITIMEEYYAQTKKSHVQPKYQASFHSSAQVQSQSGVPKGFEQAATFAHYHDLRREQFGKLAAINMNDLLKQKLFGFSSLSFLTNHQTLGKLVIENHPVNGKKIMSQTRFQQKQQNYNRQAKIMGAENTNRTSTSPIRLQQQLALSVARLLEQWVSHRENLDSIDYSCYLVIFLIIHQSLSLLLGRHPSIFFNNTSIREQDEIKRSNSVSCILEQFSSLVKRWIISLFYKSKDIMQIDQEANRVAQLPASIHLDQSLMLQFLSPNHFLLFEVHLIYFASLLQQVNIFCCGLSLFLLKVVIDFIQLALFLLLEHLLHCSLVYSFCFIIDEIFQMLGRFLEVVLGVGCEVSFDFEEFFTLPDLATQYLTFPLLIVVHGVVLWLFVGIHELCGKIFPFRMIYLLN